jgi:hypothetical protein
MQAHLDRSHLRDTIQELANVLECHFPMHTSPYAESL